MRVLRNFMRTDTSDMNWKDAQLEKDGADFKKVRWLSVEQIDAVHNQNRSVSPALVQLAYLEGQALILFIAKERGDAWIPTLLTRLRAAESDGADAQAFNAAFQEEVGQTPDGMLRSTS